MMRRRLARLLTLTLLTFSAAALPTMRDAHAAKLGTRVYMNATQGYQFAFPAAWKAARADGLDCLLKATDGQATITAKSIQGAGSTDQIAGSQAAAIAGYGAVHGKINVTTLQSGDLVIEASDAVVTAAGKRLDVQLVDVVHNGYTYDFSAVVSLDSPHSATHLREVSQSYNSIQVR
jgi:hypothetical protein